MNYIPILAEGLFFIIASPFVWYLFNTYKLMTYLRDGYPEKWNDLGRPEINKASFKATNAFWKFAWQKNTNAIASADPNFKKRLSAWRISAILCATSFCLFSFILLWATTHRMN